MTSVDILARLLAFPTVSRESNLELIGYVRGLLAERDIECTLVPDATGRKANLFATIGPRDRAGVMLSGHTDVVPVEGHDWTVPPFALTRRDGRLHGRGAADMKGFVACAIGAALQAAERPLRTPLHLALSHDEEIGCVGVRRLIEVLAEAPVKPAFAIVGEPTGMAVATGHKGKVAARATCIGREAHSALAPSALNAVHLACDFIQALRARAAGLAAAGSRDDDYDVPHTTLSVGRIAGGIALNIVPGRCEVDFDIRSVAADDPDAILEALRAEGRAIAGLAHRQAAEAEIRIEVLNAYPGLETPPDAAVVDLVKALAGAEGTCKVDYGTEGGLFAERLGVPVAICGPGSMAQGHQADEFVTEEQIGRCDAMLQGLIGRLEAGL